ncbi:MAG: hypothetical protein OWU32_10915 [Firmicutes bacterium]|nr:hypothetical protein [Bacillota bacterium]
MLTMLAWIPRIARAFGMFRGVIGFIGPIWPHVSRFLRGGARMGGLAVR